MTDADRALNRLRDAVARHHARRPNGKVTLVSVADVEALLAEVDRLRSSEQCGDETREDQ